jgi:hypothetical protein
MGSDKKKKKKERKHDKKKRGSSKKQESQLVSAANANGKHSLVDTGSETPWKFPVIDGGINFKFFVWCRGGRGGAGVAGNVR